MITRDLRVFYDGIIKGSPIIAIDYGNRKTGIAISNHEHSFSIPLEIIENISDHAKLDQITSLLNKHSCGAIVIGLPIAMNGSTTEQTKITLGFAAKLAKLTSCLIYLQDERLTSRAANNLLKSFGIKRKARNATDDSVAANIILQDTLNSISKLKLSS
ncbi:MAG: Holliday junction resolvase RuvX [Rickettsiaceae bacterium]|nr:MAG: Holliday junction resolvase RuvX [Rickettsiaceae bacterium]